MVECLFSLGLIDKKLLLPFLMSLNQVVLNLIDYFFEANNIQICDVMDSLSISIGQMLIAVIPYTFKYKSQVSLKKVIFNKKNIKYQAILWILDIVLIIFIAVPGLLSTNEELSNPYTNIMYTKEAVEIIFLIIITLFFLKYKYYKHHLISMILFCIFCVIIDLLLDNYQEGLIKQSFIKIILDIIAIIVEIFNYCYQIYMMRSLYYNYLSMCFSLGLILFIINIISLLSSLILGNPDGERGF